MSLAALPALSSLIQNAQSCAGALISALGKASLLSAVLMPLMGSGWRCERTTMSMAPASMPAAAKLAGRGGSGTREHCAAREFLHEQPPWFLQSRMGLFLDRAHAGRAARHLDLADDLKLFAVEAQHIQRFVEHGLGEQGLAVLAPHHP